MAISMSVIDLVKKDVAGGLTIAKACIKNKVSINTYYKKTRALKKATSKDAVSTKKSVKTIAKIIAKTTPEATKKTTKTKTTRAKRTVSLKTLGKRLRSKIMTMAKLNNDIKILSDAINKASA